MAEQEIFPSLEGDQNPIEKLTAQVPAAYKITDKFIEDMRAFCEKLVINGIEDKAGYTKLSDSLSRVTKYRTNTENKRVELKAPVLAYGKVIDAEAKRITALLTPIEQGLQTKKKAIDDAILKIKTDENKRRADLLIAAGYVFDGTFFVIGTSILLPSAVNEATAEALEVWIETGKQEAARIAAEKLALAATKSETSTGVPTRPIEWFNERVGQNIYCWGLDGMFTGEMIITGLDHADHLCYVGQDQQHYRFEDLKTGAAPTVVTPATPAAKPTSNAEYTASMREKTTPGGLSFAPAVSPETTEPEQSKTKYIPEIVVGFEDCRAKVLAILNDPEIKSRAIFIEKINQLKP